MSNQPPYGYPPPEGFQGGGYPPPGPPAGKTKVLGLDYNIAGLLAYLPICCINVITSIIWLASEPRENKILRFHALQSLLLTAVWIIVWVIFMILGVGLAVAPSNAAGAAGSGLVSLVYWLIVAVFLVLNVIGMVKAYQNQIWKIPIIGDIADKNT